ncbi:heterokaryon incompatibility protein-domain-containing protein [Trametes elegans]|nr:heterokaryon incompatibility protein-domain-containing protein [Trametes elegans]
MWLLRTNTAELEYFNSPRDVKGGYAILSHVWQDREQSFQELQALRAQLASESSGSPARLRTLVSTKIRECCTLAEAHGYAWLWVDTCCIDRASSAELSEAINSMFMWYARAQVCYAYLHDVPGPGATRGARRAADMLFLSQDWTALGTKAGLAKVLEDVTGVDADVLTFRRPLGDVSVARRMWWASARQTTRVEDQAYCLMGIFDVHMSTIYGEGPRAFFRLQEEILRRTSDQSLFAWGHVLPIRTAPFREGLAYSNYHQDSYIFAPSPAAFDQSRDIVPVPMRKAVEIAVKPLEIGKKAPALTQNSRPNTSIDLLQDNLKRIPLPDFTVTTHGVRARLLVIESTVGTSTLAVAVLSCVDRSTGAFVGLLLRRRADGEETWARYRVGLTVRGTHQWMRPRYRLAQVAWARHALAYNTAGISARWQRVYIVHRPPSRLPARESEHNARSASLRFLFPRWLGVELAKAGFQPDRALPATLGEAGRLSGAGAISSFTFVHQRAAEGFRIHVGAHVKHPHLIPMPLHVLNDAWLPSNVPSG